MQPLSPKKRFLVLSTLVFAFVVLTPVLLLYSTGYRIGDTFSLVRTGGIFLHSDIANARVYINDEFVENNGLILRNTLVQDLRPSKEYKVVVQKDDFHSWEKYITVHPNLVTEASILMIPTSLEKVETPKLVENEETQLITENPEYAEALRMFRFDPGHFEKEVATTTTPHRGMPPAPITTLVLDLPNFILDKEIEGIENKVEIKERNKVLAWNENGVINFIWVGGKDSIPYYFCDIEECRDEILLSFENKILRYDFFPGRNDVVLALNSHGIFAVEIDNRTKRNIQPVYIEPNVDFRLVGNTLVVLDGGKIIELEL